MIGIMQLLVILCVMAVSDTVVAGDRGSKQDAQALVKKAVEAIIRAGPEKIYSDINDSNGSFKNYDLYVTVCDTMGRVLAHGQKAALVGKEATNKMDVDGKPYILERLELAKTNQSFWQSYKFRNPATHKIEPKETYCERLNDTIICAGAYSEP